jgi:hypothetical protein
MEEGGPSVRPAQMRMISRYLPGACRAASIPGRFVPHGFRFFATSGPLKSDWMN